MTAPSEGARIRTAAAVCLPAALASVLLAVTPGPGAAATKPDLRARIEAASAKPVVVLVLLDGETVSGAFDGFAHTAEMRRIPTRAGRYNIQNVGLFLWRVQALRLVRSPLVDADDPAQGVS